jgi:hypothetical protein
LSSRKFLGALLNEKIRLSYIRAARSRWAVMRKETLRFLKRERDQLAAQLKLLQRVEWEIVHVNSGRENVTPQIVAAVEAQILRFEEIIAAYEARLN